MAEEHDSERTESASPRRLEQAREEGQVARSHELTTFAMLMSGAGGLWFLGADLYKQMQDQLRQGLTLDAAAVFDPGRMTQRLLEQSLEALWAIAPMLVMLLIVAFSVPQLLSGWLFAWGALKFDWHRLSPLAGVSRIMSCRGGMELAKALIKAMLVTGVATIMLWQYREPFLQLPLLPFDAGAAQLFSLAGGSFLVIAGSLALVAAADVPFQLWRHGEDLKMSREELRREQIESEGNPQIKSAIRNQQRAMARRRMMADVPKASVIVTNPTHYAVALRYDEQAMGAPRVVAKGTDLVAAKIREVGERHYVPVLESPALARAMYHHAEIGAEIPEQLFAAVAEVLAYVYQLRRYQVYGGPAPKPLPAVEIPAGLDPKGARQ